MEVGVGLDPKTHLCVPTVFQTVPGPAGFTYQKWRKMEVSIPRLLESPLFSKQRPRPGEFTFHKLWRKVEGMLPKLLEFQPFSRRRRRACPLYFP